jgi:hypothetical protein
MSRIQLMTLAKFFLIGVVQFGVGKLSQNKADGGTTSIVSIGLA